MHALSTDLSALAHRLADVVGQMFGDEAVNAAAKGAEFGCVKHVDLSIHQ
jgi:hypothetical protein